MNQFLEKLKLTIFTQGEIGNMIALNQLDFDSIINNLWKKVVPGPDTKIMANWIQQYIERIIYQDPVRFILGKQVWYNIKKSINIIHHINRIKKKNYIIISIDAQKALIKSNIYSWKKKFGKLGIKNNFLNLMKFI